MEHLLTTEEVADFLRVEVVTVRRLVNRSELAAYRVGGEYRFTRSDVENYLKQQRLSAGDSALGVGRDRFDKFTERARKVLTLAQKEAFRYQNGFVGTEHLFLGLINEGEGVAAKVLTDLGMKLDELRGEVEALMVQGDKVVAENEMVGITPRAKMVLTLAVDEARHLGHRYIGTEHMLLGLIREGEGAIAQLLSRHGIELEKAREQTIEVLNSLRSAEPPPVPPEAVTLVVEGEQSQTCSRCGARCPNYFHNCFNCGNRL